MPLRRADVGWNGGVAVAYFVAAKLGLTLATVGVTVTLVWPPSGVAVAAMLLLGRRVWPGVALGAFVANATTEAPIAIAWFTAVGNPLEAFVAATLLQRVGDFDSSLERTRDVLALTILGAIVAPTVGATAGVAGLVLTGVVAPSAVASSAKSDFLAVMSHELRTPLNAIIGYVSLLADGITGPLNDQQAAQLGRVKASATHLLTLIEQILSLSRIEARHEDMRVEHVDARTVVTDATTLVEPLMAAKGLLLEVELPPEPSELSTDVTKVRQILLNLLTNAGKFTERGSVRCQLRADAELVVVDVSDTGCGIASGDLDHVFDSFWQGGSADRERPEGVGLGLSVSRRLAQLLGGEITVASAPGKGSTFTLRLPRCGPGGPNGNGQTS